MVRKTWRRLDVQISELARFPAAVLELSRRESKVANGRQQAVEPGTIISLTTFPPRAGTVHYTLRSLLTQDTLPESIVLVIARDEFGSMPLPQRLRSMVQGKLQILEIERSLSSYNKIIPVLECFPNHTIVTCDDDKIYPADWFGSLVKASKLEPETIICHFARELPLHIAEHYPDYPKWRQADQYILAMNLLPLGVGGVLYPPGSLHADSCRANLFMELAPCADDLWLRFMSLRTGTPVRRLDRYRRHPESIPTTWKLRLSHGNVWENENVASFRRLLALYEAELSDLNVIRPSAPHHASQAIF